MIKQMIGINLFFATAVFAGNAPAITPALIEKGKAVYTANCLTCHGEQGNGEGPAGAYMNPKPRNFTKDKFKAGDQPQQIFKTISLGLPNTTMAGFGHLSEEDRWAATYYLISTFRKSAANLKK